MSAQTSLFSYESSPPFFSASRSFSFSIIVEKRTFALIFKKEIGSRYLFNIIQIRKIENEEDSYSICVHLCHASRWL
jgi:hypothetical protein